MVVLQRLLRKGDLNEVDRLKSENSSGVTLRDHLTIGWALVKFIYYQFIFGWSGYLEIVSSFIHVWTSGIVL